MREQAPAEITLQEEQTAVSQEARDIAGVDRLLIVAAAGLSISIDEPNNPYHSPADFAHHYPQAVRHGYRTAYQAMTLGRDESVPAEVRHAYTAAHFLNMRFRFPPTPGYSYLRQICATFAPEDTFCWTSNVDGCFERAGFDKARVYTTQGEMDKWQCSDARGCGHVWNCVEQFRAIDQASPNGVLTDLSLAKHATCPKCGRTPTLPNLRGGDWFNHQPYASTSQRLLEWLDDCVENTRSVGVIEVGVGPNTPVVTSIPAAAFASAVAAGGGRAVYLRVNPDSPRGDAAVPSGPVSYYRWQQGWAALEELASAVSSLRTRAQRNGNAPIAEQEQADGRDPVASAQLRKRYTDLLMSLRTPRA